MSYAMEEVVVGGAFVLFYSVERFNVPATSRSSTTIFRFYSGAGIYGAASMLLFLLLTRFQGLVPALFAGGAPPEFLSSLSSPFVAALLVTVLAPNVPWINGFDQRLRHKIQRLASIPTEALHLSQRLQRSPFAPTSEQQQKAIQALEGNDIPTGGALDFKAHSLISEWTKATILVHHIENLKTAAWTGSFFLESPALSDINRRYDRVSAQVVDYLRMKGDRLEDERDRAVVRQLGRTVASHVEDLLKDTCDFASRAVLHCSYTQRQRRQRLQGFGFPENPEEKMLSFDQYVQVFLALTVVALVGSFVRTDWLARPTLGDILSRSCFLSLTATLAIGCATWPIGIWSLASLRQDGRRPWTFYLLAGLGAVAFASVAQVIAYYVQTFDIWIAWAEFRKCASWLMLAFAISVITAYQVHSMPFGRWNTTRLRLLHGAAQASTLSLVGVLVYYDFGTLALEEHAEAALRLLPTTAVGGFLIGFLVPPWFRAPGPDLQPMSQPVVINDPVDDG